MTDRRFTHEQAREILRRAERNETAAEDEDLSERELFETAKELGIEAAALERAIGDVDREGELAAALREVKADRRGALRTHLFAFFLVNASLAFIDWKTGGPSWIIWPFFFWALWLLVHVVSFVAPDNDKLLQKAQRRVRTRRWKERGRKLARAVDKGVGELIDRATKE